MESYVTYEYYKHDFLQGREPMIEEEEFDYYSTQATLRIKERTFTNSDIYHDHPNVKDCTCAIAELVKLNDATRSSYGKNSETVGSHSVSYGDARLRIKKEMEDIYKNYLSRLGLLNRKVYC